VHIQSLIGTSIQTTGTRLQTTTGMHQFYSSHFVQIIWNANEYLRASELQLAWCRTFVYFVDWAVNLPEYQQLSEADQVSNYVELCKNIYYSRRQKSWHGLNQKAP